MTRTRQGVASIVVVLILGLVAVGASVALLAFSTERVKLSVYAAQASAARAAVWGCVDELLIWYNVNDVYAPNEIITAQGTCNAIVSVNAGTADALVTTTQDDVLYGVHITFSTNPIVVLTVAEDVSL
ncbi:MAG: hypothetical protein AAB570_02685 [Patescibacteria group bacterium]